MKTTFPWRAMLAQSLGAVWSVALAVTSVGAAEPVVPGDGILIEKVGDDFEDAAWKYNFNLPKGSVFNDKNARYPGGGSANGRFVEPSYRGQPDVIKRVPTPEGGLEGSKGALLLQTMQSGVPGAPSNTHQQDDLLVPFRSRFGRSIPVQCNPTCTVRVYLPPFEKWEQVAGTSFAFRGDCHSVSTKAAGMKEEYWPGLFINFEPGRGTSKPRAYFIIRSDQYGRDLRGPEITELGWWTLGMSFSPDGMVHYYAHPGVEDLVAEDRIASHMPYGFRTVQLEMFFFNVCSFDNGRSWSTPWIIDDPRLYVKTMPTKNMAELNLPTRPTEANGGKDKESEAPRRGLFRLR